MSTINGEKDSLLGQTVLPPELGQFFGGLGFFLTPFNIAIVVVVGVVVVVVVMW